PLKFDDKIFNCALVIYKGKIMGIVPKSYIPNYREFYEKRYFASAYDATFTEVNFLGNNIPFGNKLVFEVDTFNIYKKNLFSFSVEICEDLWVPVSPSSFAALAGATVICNLSASDITIGKADYRRSLSLNQSGKCIAAYMYAATGIGESTTDMAWDGQAMICENNTLLVEGERFSFESQIITTDVHIEKLVQERIRLSSFTDSIRVHQNEVSKFRKINFQFEIPSGEVPMIRKIERFPFVLENHLKRDANCYEAYNIQIHGLIKRLLSSKINHIVIGISGGLDSTQALIVAVKAMDILGLPRKNILAYTMPGFATLEKTKDNSWKLMNALGVSSEEIDIKPSCLLMLKDISHPFSDGKPVYDITFENVQAGERTSHLFRLANKNNALVLGTGDLSEIALGWCTYGVGDQMSHYNVNSSVPKTLIKYLIRWSILSNQFDKQTDEVLTSILESEITPELIPSSKGVVQSTELVVGPYELQDFNIYYITRYGILPSNVAYMCWVAWNNKVNGNWDDGIFEVLRKEYDLVTIKKWLKVFLSKFFGSTQFKRSAMPNGPKVGSGGSLSPRGDWRAPSDSVANVWLDELDKNVPDTI
ncbi:MAG: NAD(+) synthase, partial [Candidatus Kapaibacterium sp.]